VASEPLRTREAIKFGDDFELDLRAYELRRSGRLLKMERIPMELLLLLVEQRGHLVSREQIVERIWGKGIFLDTDNSINGAIRKIRQVLKDDPEQPRFLQTITGRGYRFIAPVVEQLIAENHSRSPVVIEETRPVARRMWTWVILGTAILLVAIGLYTARIWSRATVSKLTEKDTIVLADFVNTTSDPVFDDALKQALSVVLTQSPFLNVASDLQVTEMLRRMGRTPNDQLTREAAREACLRMGGKAILVGSISSLGSHYVVGLQALGCARGDMLATGQAEAANKESVLKALDGVASQVRGKVGESLLSLEKYDFPVDTTTKSLEALKAFSMGQRALRESGEIEAIPFFQQAIQLDPDFALAYTTRGRAYEDVGEDSEAVEDFTKAYDLRKRLSERERYYITTLYSETVTGDMERAREAGELWTQAYPRDGVAREKLGTVYGELGEQEKANTQFQEALRLDPGSTINVFNSVTVAAALNRLDEAQRTLEAAQARGLDGPVIHESTYPLAFLRGDRAEMERQVAWAAGKGDTEYVLFSQHSDTEAYDGRLRRARELSRRAVESATRYETKETAALCQIAAAFREMETGNEPLARQGVSAALSLAPNRNVKLVAALVLAKSGDAARARELTRELENKNPFNTLIKSYWLPTVKASLEVRAGNPQTALSLLQIAAPYELAQTSNVSNVSNMYPAYIRGQAYLLAHNGGAAAAEFKKLLDHRGIVQNSILGALSLLQLARAEVMMGDLDGARKQYSDFLSLWKDADPDVPILMHAKAEYAKLE
jgi:DNA-binding winged helix-turn-helix (wHTH) protein/tetratricopeptide (TPR) repeat protein